MTQKNDTAISLSILAIIELLERFGYYGMRSLLVIFAIDSDYLALDTSEALRYYGAFTLLIGIMALPMGFLSDLFFKQKTGVLIGGILLFFGYSLLISGNFFLVGIALLLIVFGTGLFRPNLTVLVGRLFPKTDEKRDVGFLIFYMAVNIGALLSTIAVGFVGQEYGYETGFGICALAMFSAMILFFFTKETLDLKELNDAPTDYTLHPLDSPLLRIPKNTGSPIHENRILVLLLLVFTSGLFWGIYEIIANNYYSILHTKEGLTLFGQDFQVAFQSFNGFITFPLIIVLILVGYFGNLGSTLRKIGIGVILIGIFSILISQINSVSENLFITYSLSAFTLLTVAELFVSPFIMSYVTRLSDVKYSSTMIGLLIMIPVLAMKLIGFMQSSSGFGPSLYVIAVIAIVIGTLFIVFQKSLKENAGGLD